MDRIINNTQIAARQLKNLYVNRLRVREHFDKNDPLLLKLSQNPHLRKGSDTISDNTSLRSPHRTLMRAAATVKGNSEKARNLDSIQDRQALVNSEGNRALVFLVETSDAKKPPTSELGKSDEVRLYIYIVE